MSLFTLNLALTDLSNLMMINMKSLNYILSISVFLYLSQSILAQPIGICSGNPHYYFYKNKPIVLITSAEHYGGVVNKEFDYIRYFNMLRKYKLNYTRIYPGYLIEKPGLFLKDNTLAPTKEGLIVPWIRSNVPGYINGGNKFDLSKWDKAFFQRLRDFVEEAGKRGIIVEICYFNAISDVCWPYSPLYKENNIQGTGTCHFKNAQTLKDTALARREADYVRKIVQEVNEYDNVIHEICDEPTVHGTPLELAGEWVRYMVDVIRKTEKNLPKKHLIAQQIVGPLNGPLDFSEDKDVDVLVGQYAGVQFYGDGRAKYYDAVQEGGILALDDKYGCNKPIEFNETLYYPLDYKVDSIADSRVEAWEFIVGGGAGFNQLNGRFTISHPDGNTPDNIQILTSLRNLSDFINSFDFVNMKPDNNVVNTDSLNEFLYYRVISNPGNEYALYMHHSFLEYNAYYVIPGKYKTSLDLKIPEGTYLVEWIVPETGKVCKSETINNKRDSIKLVAPEYTIDIAVRIKKLHDKNIPLACLVCGELV